VQRIRGLVWEEVTMSDFSGRLANVAGLPAAVTGDNLAHLAGDQATWVWDGYLAHGSVTLLTSQWKLGKTTLLSERPLWSCRLHQ
jgi:hypothetical protein